MARVAGDYDYETGGTTYATYRRADPRIAAVVHAALGDARTVVNVGAGAGSYEPTDRPVVAVEPSAAMRAKRTSASPVVDAVAEALPFPAYAFDAAMAVATVHQWPDHDTGLRELRRVARGPVAVVTFDAAVIAQAWFAEYTPEIAAADGARMPTPEAVAACLGGRTEISVVPIPLDCTDGFAEAYYGRPERLLEEPARRAQSGWAFLPPGAEERAVERLRADLADGTWDARHGHLRTQPWHEGSLRLVVSRP
jgi:ubiquinone/menaquinone biosynthesis C-methylase UbiE